MKRDPQDPPPLPADAAAEESKYRVRVAIAVAIGLGAAGLAVMRGRSGASPFAQAAKTAESQFPHAAPDLTKPTHVHFPKLPRAPPKPGLPPAGTKDTV